MDHLNDIHPGAALKLALQNEGISQNKFSQHIGVGAAYVSDICNGKRSISPMMALKISRALGGDPEIWIQMQSAYDLAEARKLAKRHGVNKIRRMAAAA